MKAFCWHYPPNLQDMVKIPPLTTVCKLKRRQNMHTNTVECMCHDPIAYISWRSMGSLGILSGHGESIKILAIALRSSSIPNKYRSFWHKGHFFIKVSPSLYHLSIHSWQPTIRLADGEPWDTEWTCSWKYGQVSLLPIATSLHNEVKSATRTCSLGCIATLHRTELQDAVNCDSASLIRARASKFHVPIIFRQS